MVSEKQRRLLRERRKHRFLADDAPLVPSVQHDRGFFHKIYRDHYKSLFIITVLILIASLAIIAKTYVETGDVIYTGVSLSGGITIHAQGIWNPDGLQEELLEAFPDDDIIVRAVTELGTQRGVTIEAATLSNSDESLAALEQDILAYLRVQQPDVEVSTEIVGPSLGQSFFQQTMKAILVAFALMGLVVFLYFGQTLGQKIIVTFLALLECVLIWNASDSTFMFVAAAIAGIVLIVLYVRYSIPSAAVILAAVSTIIFTAAVVDLMEMRISTAGIAAFLMLIGYSVDTDILLSARVLKRNEGTVYDRVVSTIKTGMTMQATTFTAALVGLFFAQSEVIKEIMRIILIGIIADIFFTWIQNAGILRLWLEKREKA